MASKSTRRVLVLGASGLVGTAVLREASRYPELFRLGEQLRFKSINRQVFALLTKGVHSDRDFSGARAYTGYATVADARATINSLLYAFSRIGVSILWLTTAIGMWFFWPCEESLQLLSLIHPSLGTTGWLAASCLLNATMGVLSVVAPSKKVWKAQFGLTACYTAGLIVAMPGNLAHPLGMLTKNFCVLAVQAYPALNEKK